MDYQFWRFPELADRLVDLYEWDGDRDYFEGQLIDVYVVTDGRARFTANIPSLPGSYRGRVTDRADVRIIEISKEECIAGDCEVGGWGGEARSVDGVVVSVNYVWQKDPIVGEYGCPPPCLVVQNMEWNWGTTCIYPHPVVSPNKSADPADHAFGCDLTEGDQAPWPYYPAHGLSRALYWSGWGWGAMMHWEADGPTYVGTMGGSKSVFPDDVHKAFGLWLDPR